MSFDGFFLHHMTDELRQQLLYGRIQKINQPFNQELVLQIRSNRQNHKLLLSAHPVFSRIQPVPPLKIQQCPLHLSWLCENIYKALPLKTFHKSRMIEF